MILEILAVLEVPVNRVVEINVIIISTLFLNTVMIFANNLARLVKEMQQYINLNMDEGKPLHFD